MICSISGEPAKDPVLSPKSGRIFERSLIESYISQNGTDPFDSESALSVDELISIKTNSPIAPPRPPTLTSVPSLLASLQSQWDAFALESFTLRQQLSETRKELSTALYYHDAAVRVVARLTKERDEARTALAELSSSIGLQPVKHTNGSAAVPASEETATDNSSLISLPSETIDQIRAQKTKLSSTRGKRTPDSSWATTADITKFKANKASKQNFQNARALALGPHPIQLSVTPETEDSALYLLSGGASSKAGVFNTHSYTKNVLFSTASSLVTSNAWLTTYPTEGAVSYFAIGTKDNTIELYSVDTSASASDPKAEPGPVSEKPLGVIDLTNLYPNTQNTAVTVIKHHPLPTIIVSLSTGPSTSFWAVHDISDISQPKVLGSAVSPDGVTYTTLDVHPDGILVALGTSTGSIEIFSLDTGLQAAQFQLPGDSSSSAAVSALTFSENGYWLAAAYENDADNTMEVDGRPDIIGTALIWDLRKSSVKFTVPFALIKDSDASKAKKTQNITTTISKLAFDFSGAYLAAIAGSNLAIVGYVKASKNWTPQLAAAGSEALDPQILENGGSLFATSVSHSLVDVAWGPLGKSLYTVTDKGSFQEFSLK